VVYVLPRADLGTRLGSSIKVALALYMNRKIYLEWLEERTAAVGSNSKLEACLYALLSSSEVLAAIRARVVLHVRAMRLLRFFTNSGELGFSPADMGPVADSPFEFLCDLEADGSKGMDVSLDVSKFAGDSTADTSEEQRAKDINTKEAYASWKAHFLKRQGRCIDGSARVLMWELAVAEVFDPGGADNKATDGLVKDLLEVWARGMKDGMVTTPLKDSLSTEEGKHSTEVVTDKMRKDLSGSGTNNDMSERVLPSLVWC